MTEAIIVAVIAGVCAVIGQALIARSTNNSLLAKLEKQSELTDQSIAAKLDRYQAVTDTKLETLTEEVRRHNAFAERIPVLENRITTLEGKN